MQSIVDRPVKTIKEFSDILIEICNAFKKREITQEELVTYTKELSVRHPEKLFDGNDLNPTVKQLIGIKRTVIIKNIVDGK